MSGAVVTQDDAGTAAPARWGLRIAAIVLCAWVLVPIYLLAVDAFNAPAAVTGWPKRFWPAFDLTSLAFFWNYAGVTRALMNSLLVAGLTMVLSILIGAPAGYALARFRFRGKGAFRILVLMTRAFPLPLLALPLAVFYLRTGLDDTLLGLALIHTVLALPFAILITSSLFVSIPVELEEAAWVFGCNRPQAFVRIVAPLALPGIAASGVFAFVTSWNEVFAASVLTVQNQTLTAFLLTSLDVSPLPLKFAGAFVLIIPALIFLFLVRKYLFSLWGIANR
ncbi:sugar ABC transporter permease [Labrys okinawensis]|uniref:Sugar ABC transporter permease n=1 Tax=Labrys okinawensis TaxID=346911 RepID=A0A2S9Q9U4_9HYPH|nr:carbohydrate ABC transporter permease [Labrys okinawensis]PRH86109.1 sugar ABC transporter permease [Labrys okinawensis]